MDDFKRNFNMGEENKKFENQVKKRLSQYKKISIKRKLSKEDF